MRSCPPGVGDNGNWAPIDVKTNREHSGERLPGRFVQLGPGDRQAHLPEGLCRAAARRNLRRQQWRAGKRVRVPGARCEPGGSDLHQDRDPQSARRADGRASFDPRAAGGLRGANPAFLGPSRGARRKGDRRDDLAARRHGLLQDRNGQEPQQGEALRRHRAVPRLRPYSARLRRRGHREASRLALLSDRRHLLSRERAQARHDPPRARRARENQGFDRRDGQRAAGFHRAAHPDRWAVAGRSRRAAPPRC